MLVFESADARKDQAEFQAEGLHGYEPFDFERKAKLPDGKEVTVGFSLAFVTDPRAPEAVFFTCQQHAPEYFWKPEYQEHPNGARSVEEVVMVAPEPRALEDLFVGLQGRERVAAHADSLTVQTARGRISVHSPGGFEARFSGLLPESPPEGAYFAAYVIGVEDLGRCGVLLAENGVAYTKDGRLLQVSPDKAFGCVVAFKELNED